MSEIEADLTTLESNPVQLDLEVLSELQDLLEEDFHGLLEDFIDSSNDLCQQLLPALEGGDLSTLRRDAHSLKGSALNIGAPELGAAWSELEEGAAAALDKAQLQTMLDAGQAELVRTIAALTSGFLSPSAQAPGS